MSWSQDAIFYHIYPLGALGAPRSNDFTGPPAPRLASLISWLAELTDLGVTALYLGPVFESSTHGYDTADYFQIDRRLGDHDTLRMLVDACHERGLRVVLDAVFHHVGRDFWAFRDVLERGEASPYRGWFHLDFSRPGAYSTPFSYQGWSGNFDLVKLNTDHPAVREHLLDAAGTWIERYGIDGLRLDAAADLDRSFQRELARHCRAIRPDCWLVGEVVSGDYTRWANAEALDSVTNYVLYKALYSSHNDRNYFELAHTLSRQFGPGGTYGDLSLYTFADNHDVDRVASVLANAAHLYPLYGLLFTLPGIPAIYYGSEYALPGRRTRHCDTGLRPPFEAAAARRDEPAHPLRESIGRFARLRHEHEALRGGSYQPVHVGPEQMAFLRASEHETLLVAANASRSATELSLALPEDAGSQLVDLLDGGAPIPIARGRARVAFYPTWTRVFRLT